jgi:DNA-binding response OmpR family regulator
MARSVLVVDDEPSILLALEFVMKNAGFAVRTARNGEEAIKALGEERPDLLLLDVMIPPPDGYDVCQRVRSTPALKDIPIIMLTARGRDVEREKGLAMGADDYVTKPFSTRDLMTKVRELLEDERRRKS